jgi:hypothetical protein
MMTRVANLFAQGPRPPNPLAVSMPADFQLPPAFSEETSLPVPPCLLTRNRKGKRAVSARLSVSRIHRMVRRLIDK